MFLIDLVFALLIAFLVTVLLTAVFGWRHPSRQEEEAALPGAFFLFLILFFFIWAGGAWIGPFGPVLWSGAWLPFLVVGVVIGLFLLAVSEPPRPSRQRSAHTPPPGETDPAPPRVILYGVVFWILLLVLLAVVIAAYTA